MVLPLFSPASRGLPCKSAVSCARPGCRGGRAWAGTFFLTAALRIKCPEAPKRGVGADEHPDLPRRPQ